MADDPAYLEHAHDETTQLSRALRAGLFINGLEDDDSKLIRFVGPDDGTFTDSHLACFTRPHERFILQRVGSDIEPHCVGGARRLGE